MQLTKIKSTLPPTTIVNIYRPPSSSRAVFLDELAELISVISADTNAGLLLCGDVNCTGKDTVNIDNDLQSMVDSFGFTQLVNTPTRGDNILDIYRHRRSSCRFRFLSADDAGLVSHHRLVLVKFRARPAPRQPARYTYRNVKRIDTVAFQDALRQSALFTSPATSNDGFADQLADICPLNSTRWRRYMRKRDVNLNEFLIGCGRRPSRRNVNDAAWRRCVNGAEKNRTALPTKQIVVRRTNS